MRNGKVKNIKKEMEIHPSGYGEHIVQTVESLPYKTVIQTKDIALRLAERFALPYNKAKAATNVKLKRMADSGEIKRLHKGVYAM